MDLAAWRMIPQISHRGTCARGNSEMETDVSQDFEDYWNEYRILQETKLLDDYLEEVEDYGSRSCDEGEQEAEWLRAAGLPQLTTPFEQGLELHENELDPALRLLPAHHAEAVRRRVRTLNFTVRKRGRQQRSRPRKPDIRDVFRDVENSSTGTRSRSATPDSLDSEHPGLEEVEPHSPPLPWCLPRGNHPYQQHGPSQGWPGQNVPSFRNFLPSTSPGSNEQFYGSYNKAPVQRVASHSTNEIFRRAGGWNANHHRADVATDSEGVQILGYQRLGTIHLPRPRERARTGSDPTSPPYKMPSSIVYNNNVANVTERNKLKASNLSRSHSSLYIQDRDAETVVQQRAAARAVLRRSGSQGHIGFEELSQRPLILGREKGTGLQHKSNSSIYWDPNLIGRTWVEYLGEDDLLKLKSFLLLEATALLDDADIPFRRRKAPRKKRKTDNNVFGVPLSTLLEKDRHISAEDSQAVPLIFQKVLLHLERYGLREEGILRIGGLQQKVTVLCHEIEAVFYTRSMEEVDRLLQQATCHDVSGVLKRLLRDLPQPLLSVEYIDMFYQTHALPDDDMRAHALNLLVLLLPPVHRNTLRALFRFLIRVIRNQKYNKMSQHNVAMIMAPSLFPPRYIHPPDKRDLQAQVEVASLSCQVTEQMLELGETLWVVPESLVRQIRRSNEEEHYRKGAKENNKPMMKLLGKRAGVREPITRRINNEVDFQDGVMRITAPQFQLTDFPIKLTENTTAGDVVLRIVDEAIKRYESPANSMVRGSRRPYHDVKSRALAELAPNGNLSCILATGTSELALQSHFLYEIGGNIGQRQIEHEAVLLAVYKENPNAQWVLHCHHRNANNAPT